MFDHAARQARLSQRLEDEGIDALFLAPSADLEYLTGVERQLPFFGEATYAHGWVTGAFFRPRARARLSLPADVRGLRPAGAAGGRGDRRQRDRRRRRDLRTRRRSRWPATDTVALGDRVWSATALRLGAALGFERLRTGSRLVNELRRVKTGDELAAMGRAVETVEQTMAAVAPLVVPGVSMAELVEAVEHELREAGSRCPSFATHIFTGLGEDRLRLGHRDGSRPDPGGHVGDVRLRRRRRRLLLRLRPHDLRRRAAAGLSRRLRGRCSPRRRRGGPAATPGALARDVNAACRGPIEDAGLGEHFRHRMGHGIGMDVHERPFLSAEDETPLEAGMTFTDEPSIIIPGRWSLRIEDVIVVEEGGGRSLNSYPTALTVEPVAPTSPRPSSRRPNTPSCRRRSSGRTSRRTPASAASSGKYGPEAFSWRWNAGTGRSASWDRWRPTQHCASLLDRRGGARRPAGAETDELTRRERQVVGGIRVVRPPQRQAEGHLAAAVARQPRCRSGSPTASR